MNKTNPALISDALALFFVAWLLSLSIFRYFRFNTFISLSVSILLGVSCALPFYFLLRKREKRALLKRKDVEEKEKLMLHLALSPKKETLDRMEAVLLSTHQRNDEGFFNGEELLLPFFYMQPASADEVAKRLRYHPDKKLVLWCNDLSPEAKKLCERLGIKAVYADEVYLALKQANALPTRYLCEENGKVKRIDKLLSCVRKKNARSFFFSGCGLLVLSVYSFFPLYYLIAGGSLALSSLFVRIFGK